MEKKTTKREFTGFDPRIGWGVRLAYAGGDVACNIVFGMIGTLLTIFYTDTAHVDVAAIGYIMLGSRIFDGFSDIIMGIVVEKTHSRFGKARPWLLWMSVPFCLSAVLLFTVPQVSNDLMWVKILYVAVTYNFCTTVCYTAINLPYGTLSTLMTRDSHERDMLGNVRMGLSPLGKILSVTFTLPLVGVLGGETDQNAWVKAMSIWAAVGLILLIINFMFCKEKVNTELPKTDKIIASTPEIKEEKKVLIVKENEPVKQVEKVKKLPLKKGLKFLVKNKYFWAVLLLWMFQSVSFGVVGTTLPYYCKWIIGDSDMYSWLFLAETLTLVAGVFACMPLVKKLGKRNMALGGSIIAILTQVIQIVFVYIGQYNNVGMLYSVCILRSIGLAPLNAVVFGMLGDVVDFGHWKNGVRQESFICAGGSVGTKLGSGLASLIITQSLNFVGYDGNLDPAKGEIQNAATNDMIKGLYTWGPMVIAIGVFLVLFFYKLDKHYDKMMQELRAREEAETNNSFGDFKTSERSK